MTSTTTANEPDELYTLRAQYWLGHYSMAINECKSLGRRPGMNNALKIERDELLYRSYIALQQYNNIPVSTTYESTSLQAWAMKGQYEQLISQGVPVDDPRRCQLVDSIKVLAQNELNNNSSNNNSSVLVAAAQILLLHDNQISAAYSMVANGTSLEILATKLHILLKIDRYDLATKVLQQLKQNDEDSIVTQLCSVYVLLSQGKSGGNDAIHTLNSLCEQYGTSSLLFNLLACSYITIGDYTTAESKLQECINEHTNDTSTNGIVTAETFINMIICTIHQNKINQSLLMVQELQTKYPHHPYCTNVTRTINAFDREAIVYKN